MFGVAARSTLRASAPRQALRRNLSRRFISSTPPAQKRRSWTSSLARWGIGIGGLYYATTSDVFSKERPYSAFYNQTSEHDYVNLQTVDELADARRERRGLLAAAAPIPAVLDAPSPSTSPELSMAASTAALRQADIAPSSSAATSASEAASSPSSSTSSQPASTEPSSPNPSEAGSPEELEEEAGQQGAFNEETGEINWDCPCLGGMAHGPCGPEFREAFGCFVYSKEEPKGVDCIDKFKGMQECFRLHPDVYGAELADDEEEQQDAVAGAGDTDVAPVPASYSGSQTAQERVPEHNVTAVPSASPSSVTSSTTSSTATTSRDEASKTQKAKAAASDVASNAVDDSEGGKSLVPKSQHDS